MSARLAWLGGGILEANGEEITFGSEPESCADVMSSLCARELPLAVIDQGAYKLTFKTNLNQEPCQSP